MLGTSAHARYRTSHRRVAHREPQTAKGAVGQDSVITCSDSPGRSTAHPVGAYPTGMEGELRHNLRTPVAHHNKTDWH